MTTERENATAKQDIKKLIEDWAAACRGNDIEGLMAGQASDILTFDCHSLMQIKGATALRDFLEGCLACMQGGMEFEIHELQIAAEGDLGFAHYLANTSATGQDGAAHSGWLRVTLCCRKQAGAWQVVHAHVSAPFDPMTGQTMFGLTREELERRSAA